MDIDLQHGPFSSFGSTIAIQFLPAVWNFPGLILRTMRSTTGVRESFRLHLRREGHDLPFDIEANPVTMCLVARDGSARATLCLPTPELLRFHVNGADLAFETIPGQSVVAHGGGPGIFLVNAPAVSARYRFRSLTGELRTQAYHHVRLQDSRHQEERPTGPWATIVFHAADGVAQGDLEDYTCSPVAGSPLSWKTALGEAQNRWSTWLQRIPSVPDHLVATAERAMWITYSSALLPAPWSPLKRPTILMSKNWMTRCWSWDHCFNAVALAPSDPDLAWDQMATIFEHQSPSGMLPDDLGANVIDYNFCKPPIHGWAFERLFENPAIATPEHLADARRWLASWSDWWLRERDLDGDGLPEYQHGNDSGWDNGTCFDAGLPVATPDLAAFLSVQLRALASLETQLGDADEALRRHAQADALIERLEARLIVNGRPRARLAFDGGLVETGDSLMPFLALLAAPALSPTIRRALCDGLLEPGRFLTSVGVATESLLSDRYVPNGYWRGPSWPPTVVLAAEALERAGCGAEARAIAAAFCDNCARTQCFAENYDAETGAPLRDLAYTWASSAFLFLAHRYLLTPEASHPPRDQIAAVASQP